MRRLLVFAVVLGACVATPAASRAPSSTPSSTVTATATATEAAASPSPSPTASPQRTRLGLVIADPGPPFVVRLRTEDEPTPFATLSGTGAAVSPDGVRLAYWHRDAGASDRQDALRVVDLFTGNETEITKLANEIPAGIAWRDDGGGLLFASRSPSISGGGADPPPLYTAVRLFLFTSKEIRDLKRLEAARFFPLGWNLAAHVVSGVDSGEGGIRRVYRFNEDGTSAGDTPGESRFQEIADVTRDAKEILGRYAFFTGGKSFSGIRTVSAVDARPIAEREAADGTFLLSARFRPGTNDVLALLRVTGDPSRYSLELWPSSPSAAPRRVWTGPPSTYASGDLIARVDGKAAYVRVDVPAGPSLWHAVDLNAGTSTALAMGSGAPPGGPSFFTTDEGIAKLKALR